MPGDLPPHDPTPSHVSGYGVGRRASVADLLADDEADYEKENDDPETRKAAAHAFADAQRHVCKPLLVMSTVHSFHLQGATRYTLITGP